MKAGALPRRALVLLKQSKSRPPSQGSTTSHRTGKWLPGSASRPWPWPCLSMALPQPSCWQMRVASSGRTAGSLATAPHSPSTCSSTEPEQPRSPSTSRSLGGPGQGGREGAGGKTSRYRPGPRFSPLLSRKSPKLPRLALHCPSDAPTDGALTRGLRAGGRRHWGGLGGGFHRLWKDRGVRSE